MADFEELLGGWGWRIDDAIRRIQGAWLEVRYRLGWKVRPEPVSYEETARRYNALWANMADSMSGLWVHDPRHGAVITNMPENDEERLERTRQAWGLEVPTAPEPNDDTNEACR
jgi:hypothetical protein